jgi:hypothetical protein
MHAASKLVGGERLRRQVAAGILRARLQELDRIVKDWDLQGMHLYREVRAAELRVSIEEIANA